MHGVWTAANRLSTGGLTGIVGKATIAAKQCGSGLARESGGSVGT
ncbi:hypothetical protein JMUB7501_26960 [Staphylococcus aureus]